MDSGVNFTTKFANFANLSVEITYQSVKFEDQSVHFTLLQINILKKNISTDSKIIFYFISFLGES